MYTCAVQQELYIRTCTKGDGKSTDTEVKSGEMGTWYFTFKFIFSVRQ